MARAENRLAPQAGSPTGILKTVTTWLESSTTASTGDAPNRPYTCEAMTSIDDQQGCANGRGFSAGRLNVAARAGAVWQVMRPKAWRVALCPGNEANRRRRSGAGEVRGDLGNTQARRRQAVRAGRDPGDGRANTGVVRAAALTSARKPELLESPEWLGRGRSGIS